MNGDSGYVNLNSVDTEKSLIGAVLVSPDNFLQVNWLRSECFYEIDNGKIWDVICGLFSKGLALDLPTVSQELKKQGEGNELSINYVLELTNAGIGAENVLEFAQFIYDLHVKRDMHNFLIRKTDDFTNLAIDSEDILDEIVLKLNGLHENLYQTEALAIKEIIGSTRDRILRRKYGEEGVDDIDSGLAGLKIPNGLVILAARPSMGKSSLCIQLCNNIAIDQSIPVALFELEMSKEQIVRWILSQRTEIPNEKLRTGDITDEEESLIEKEIGKIEGASLFVDDTSGMNVIQVRSKAIKLRNKYGIKLIIIDYLQLMSGVESRGKIKNRENEVSEISRQLKVLQKELGIPIIAVAQLNRDVVNRADKIPRLSDLRESGALEQDADMVMFIHRPEYYGIDSIEGRDTKGLAQLMIEKYRDGALDWKEVRFIPERVSFKNMGSGFAEKEEVPF